MLRRDLYVARRVGEREFEVEYIGDAVFLKDYLDCGIFPLFWRCRRVTVTDDGKLVCSCKAFEEDGIPCEHIACVVEAVMKACEGKEWKGFTVNDISVRWWSSYMYLAYRETTDDDTNAMFHWLATNDITGPSLPCAISASMPIEPRQKEYTALERLKNYKPEEIGTSGFDGHKTSVCHEPNDSEAKQNHMLSQFSYVAAAQDLFEESIHDEVGCDAVGVGGLRNSLYQLWNEACDAADQAGDQDLNAELAGMLKNFVSSAHAKAREKNAMKKKKRKGVAHLLPSINTGPSRVFNTKSMI